MSASHSQWTPRPADTRFAAASLAIVLVDDLTGSPPLGRIDVKLEREWSAGLFEPVDARPVVTPAGILAFFGLERRRFAPGAAPVRYRIAVSSPRYRAAYRETKDFEEILVVPFDDLSPPPPTPDPLRIVLFPSPAYRFDAATPVARGEVRDEAGRPVPDALVTQGMRERAVSDEQGRFALPLRWVASGIAVDIEAAERPPPPPTPQRTGRTTVTLPQSIATSITVVVKPPP